MKNILLTILFVCILVTQSYAFNPVTVCPGVPTGEAACSTPDNGDELDEGFPSTPDLTWTDTNSTITDGADLPGTGPTGTWNTCDVGARFQADNSSPWKYHNLGSAIARTKDIVITIVFYIDTASLTSYGVNKIFSFGSTTTATSNLLAEVHLSWVSGTGYRFKIEGDTDSGFIVGDLDTYYKLTITLEGDHDGTSNLDIDSWNGSAWADLGSENFTRYDSVDGQYVHVGPYTGIATGETLDIYFSLVSINTPND